MDTNKIDQCHKFHNALTNITQCTILTEMCTLLLPNGALWDMGLTHCGIWEWWIVGLGIWSIDRQRITWCLCEMAYSHYNDVIMSAMASQITSFTIVNSTFYSSADLRKHQNSASLAFVTGIHRWPGNCPHKGPVTRKIFPFDDVIMSNQPLWRLYDVLVA